MVLNRNASVVLKSVRTVVNQLIALQPCKIQIPVRFTEIGLGSVGVDTYSLGCLAIILEDGTYGTLMVNSLVQLEPYKTIIVDIDDIDYYEFYFDEGDVIIKSMEVIKDDDIPYRIFDELVFQGKVPWYVSYTDMCKLFDTAKEFAGSNVGQNQETIEFIASIITRPVSDRSTYLRNTISKYSDITSKAVSFVPLMSVVHSVNNTLNKLSGSHFSDGISSAIVNPSETSSDLEKIVRR